MTVTLSPGCTLNILMDRRGRGFSRQEAPDQTPSAIRAMQGPVNSTDFRNSRGHLVDAREDPQPSLVSLSVPGPLRDGDHFIEPSIPFLRRTERARCDNRAEGRRLCPADVVPSHRHEDLRAILGGDVAMGVGTPDAVLALPCMVCPVQLSVQFGSAEHPFQLPEPFAFRSAVRIHVNGFADVLHVHIAQVLEPHRIPSRPEPQGGHLTLHRDPETVTTFGPPQGLRTKRPLPLTRYESRPDDCAGPRQVGPEDLRLSSHAAGGRGTPRVRPRTNARRGSLDVSDRGRPLRSDVPRGTFPVPSVLHSRILRGL